MIENLDKDKSLASLTHKMDRNTESLSRKTSDFISIKEEKEKEKAQMTEKLEMTR